MGARAHMFPRLMQIMPEEIHFGYIGRPERASPGEGYPAAHVAEQSRIVQHRAGPRACHLAVPAQDSGGALSDALATLHERPPPVAAQAPRAARLTARRAALCTSRALRSQRRSDSVDAREDRPTCMTSPAREIAIGHI